MEKITFMSKCLSNEDRVGIYHSRGLDNDVLTFSSILEEVINRNDRYAKVYTTSPTLAQSKRLGAKYMSLSDMKCETERTSNNIFIVLDGFNKEFSDMIKSVNCYVMFVDGVKDTDKLACKLVERLDRSFIRRKLGF